MDLLLKRNRLGHTVAGSDALLLARATSGDDLTAYEASSIFDCHIIFANYAVSHDRVSGLSLPHLAFGDLTAPERLAQEPIDTIQYIYDSYCKNLLCRDVLDENRTVTEVFANNPHYAGFTWYSTRRYVPVPYRGIDNLKARGDQFKIRLNLAADFYLIIKPDIIFFPAAGRDFLVKSAPMILPSALAQDPGGYLRSARPLIANQDFSLVYLAIGSDGSLTIVQKQRFSIQESLENNLHRSFSVSHPTARFTGHRHRDQDPHTQVTRIPCDYTLLAPYT
jgi:hypothetical protein